MIYQIMVIMLALFGAGCETLIGSERSDTPPDGSVGLVDSSTDQTVPIAPDLAEVRPDLVVIVDSATSDLSLVDQNAVDMVANPDQSSVDLTMPHDLLADLVVNPDLTDGAMPPDLAAKDAGPDLFNACKDGVKNQDETDVDCGGKICDPCLDGKLCKAPSDCQNGGCFVPPDDAVKAIGAKPHCAASGKAPNFRVEYYATSFGDATVIVCSIKQGQFEVRTPINQLVLNGIGNMDMQPGATSTTFRNVNVMSDIAKNVAGYVIWYNGASAPFKVGYANQPGLIGFSSDPAFPDNNL